MIIERKSPPHNVAQMVIYFMQLMYEHSDGGGGILACIVEIAR